MQSYRKLITIIFGVTATAIVIAAAAILIPRNAKTVELNTLCRYISTAVTDAHCTAMVETTAFPVGNVVSIPLPPNKMHPLQPTLRDFVRACWIDEATVKAISKDLSRPAADMALPGFSSEISRTLTVGSNLDIVEADSLKMKAGSQFKLIKRIVVEPREPRIIQLDQALIETYLRRPEVREDCIPRLLRDGTRLVVSIIIAKGLAYKIETSDGATLELSAAAQRDLVKFSAGQQASGNTQSSTELSFADYRVIGAVFADQVLISDLKAIIKTGPIVQSRGRTTVSGRLIEVRSGWNRGIQADQNPDNTFTFGGIPNEMLAVVLSSSPGAQKSIGAVVPPVINGRVSVQPMKVNILNTSMVSFDANMYTQPGRIQVDSRRIVGFPPRIQVVTETVPTSVLIAPKLIGEFDVFKRSAEPESLRVNISRRVGVTPPAAEIEIRVENSAGISLEPGFRKRLVEMETGAFEKTYALSEPNKYRVLVQYDADPLGQSLSSFVSQMNVEVTLTKP